MVNMGNTYSNTYRRAAQMSLWELKIDRLAESMFDKLRFTGLLKDIVGESTTWEGLLEDDRVGYRLIVIDMLSEEKEAYTLK